MAAVAEMVDQPMLIEPPAAGHSTHELLSTAGVTLEDIVLETWEDLAGSGRAECPVCGGSLRATRGCESCGSELS